jgi:hypothetical protein
MANQTWEVEKRLEGMEMIETVDNAALYYVRELAPASTFAPTILGSVTEP